MTKKIQINMLLMMISNGKLFVEIFKICIESKIKFVTFYGLFGDNKIFKAFFL